MSQLFTLSGKVAVITGAGGVLGGCMAEYLASQGVRIAVLDLRKEQALAQSQRILNAGGAALAFAGSVLEEADMQKALNEIISAWGQVDILINCAGGNMAGATISPDQTVFDLSMDAFKKVMDLNLFGSVLPSMVFGKQMANQGGGSHYQHFFYVSCASHHPGGGLFCRQSCCRKFYAVVSRRNGPKVWRRHAGQCHCSWIFYW